MRSDNLKRHYKNTHTESNQTVVPEKPEPKKTKPRKEERVESNQSETPKKTVTVRVCCCSCCEKKRRQNEHEEIPTMEQLASRFFLGFYEKEIDLSTYYTL